MHSMEFRVILVKLIDLNFCSKYEQTIIMLKQINLGCFGFKTYNDLLQLTLAKTVYRSIGC